MKERQRSDQLQKTKTVKYRDNKFQQISSKNKRVLTSNLHITLEEDPPMIGEESHLKESPPTHEIVTNTT